MHRPEQKEPADGYCQQIHLGSDRIKTARIWIISLIAVAGMLLADQWTKHLAVLHLKGQPAVPLIDGVFQLNYIENRGAAFGIMQGRQLFFVVCTVVITLAILYLCVKMPYEAKYDPLRFCAVLIWSGAAGNMIDRLRLDYVVDFFDFCLIDFPVFNVADCYVVVACILFAVLILFYYRDEEDFDFLKRRRG